MSQGNERGKRGLRVLAVTGASGGHIFPAVAFIHKLEEECPGCAVKLILPEKRISAGLEGIKVEYLDMPSLRLRPLSALLVSLCSLMKGAINGLRVLLNFRPDVVIGFGSLPSVPVVMLAWLLRIPTVVHEQNVMPGKANLFLARFCDKVAVSFPETADKIRASGRVVVTGNPVRRMKVVGKKEALAHFGMAEGRLTVLVTGGSQGSARINKTFLEAVRVPGLRERVQVIHTTGNTERETVRRGYSEAGVRAEVFSFLPQMEQAYSAADLAVSRSGASTLAELNFYALPALLIPYPFAEEHQAANAAVMAKSGSCRVIKDKELDADRLREFLLECLQGSVLPDMRASFRPREGKDAASALAGTVMGMRL